MRKLAVLATVSLILSGGAYGAPTGTTSWQIFKVGGGGQTTGLNIANDGTMVARVDVFGAYVRGPSANFTGLISGTTLTVSAVSSGALAVGQLLWDAGGSIALGSYITAGSGTSWTVSTSQNVSSKSMTTSGPWRQLITEASIPSSFWNNRSFARAANNGPWEVAIAPNNSQRIYMLWAGILWVSANQGVTFVQIKAFTPIAIGDSGGNQGGTKFIGSKMAVDPADQNILLIGTPDNGVFLVKVSDASTGTATSTPVNAIPTAARSIGYMIAFDVASGTTGGLTKTVYVAPNGSPVFVSTTTVNGTFSATSGGPTSVGSGCSCGGNIVVGSDETVWEADGTKLWKFTHRGGWSKIINMNQGPGVQNVTVNPANPLNVVTTDAGSNFNTTSDGGASWTGPIGNGVGPSPARYATDVPWLAVTKEGYMTTGAVVFDPAETNVVRNAEGIGVWTAIPPTSVSQVNWYSLTAGIESLVSNHALSATNYAWPFYAAWDRPLFTFSNPNTYSAKLQPSYNTAEILAGWDVDGNSGTGEVCVLSTWTFGAAVYDSGCSSDGAGFTKYAHDPLLITATTSSSTSSGGMRLSFSSLPGNVQVGMAVADLKTPGAINTGGAFGTQVQSITTSPCCTVALMVATTGTVRSGDTISFAAPQGGSIAVSSPSVQMVLPSDNSAWPIVTQDGGATWNNVVIPGSPTLLQDNVTITTGNPTTVNWPKHGLSAGWAIECFGNPLPTGMATYVPYTVSSSNLNENSFQIPLATSGSSSGVLCQSRSGWGNAYYGNAKMVAADRVTVGKFYLWNTEAGQTIWTCRVGGGTYSCSSTYTGNRTIGNGGGGNSMIKAVPGNAGHLLLSGANSTFVNSPLSRSCNGGVSWFNFAKVSYVSVFGFGARAPGNSFPTVFFAGEYNGVSGIWRSDNVSATCPPLGTDSATFVRIGDIYTSGWLDPPSCIEGDANIWGQVYVCASNSGLRIGKLNFLLKRDLEPVANDSSPTFMDDAA